MKRSIGSALLIMALGSPVGATAGVEYQRVDPLFWRVDLEKLGIENHLRADEFMDIRDGNCAIVSPKFCVAIGMNRRLDWRGTANSPEYNYGHRLFLIESTMRGFQVRYSSRGSADTYNMSPTFYRHPTTGALLVLAEEGAEYSWGARVFLFQKNRISDIGTLNVSPISDQITIENCITIRQDGIKLVFGFTTDVIVNPGSPNSEEVPQGKISYEFDGVRLRRTKPSD
jgi:hypothetical protein